MCCNIHQFSCVAPLHCAAPAVTYSAPAPVVKCTAPAPAVSWASLAPAVYAAPSPVMEYIFPAPAVSFVCLLPLGMPHQRESLSTSLQSVHGAQCPSETAAAVCQRPFVIAVRREPSFFLFQFFLCFLKRSHLCLHSSQQYQKHYANDAEELERSFQTKAYSEKYMKVNDVNVTDEDDFLSRCMMIKANNKTICNLKEDQSEFLEERRQKDSVNEFAALTTSESVSRYSGYNPTMCRMV